MSGPIGTPKKKVSETVSFMKTTNPEIFHIQPRPGGVLHIEASDFKISEFNDKSTSKIEASIEPQTQVDEKISKEFRVQTAIGETESIYSEDATVPNPIKDAMYMFGVTISSLMLLATDQSNIPEDYMRWTAQCLECIKDDFGNHPPNVQGMLNHIKYLNNQKGSGATPQTNEDKPPDTSENVQPTDQNDPTIRTTTRVKMDDEEDEEDD